MMTIKTKMTMAKTTIDDDGDDDDDDDADEDDDDDDDDDDDHDHDGDDDFHDDYHDESMMIMIFLPCRNLLLLLSKTVCKSSL